MALPRPFLLAFVLPAAVLAFAENAAAYERQWHVGARLGYSGLIGDTTGSGLGGGVHLDYGLTDTWNLMTRVDVHAYPDLKVLVPSATAGVGAAFDVVQFVPYGGVLVGAADVATMGARCDGALSPCHRFKLAIEVPVGVDYMISRSFSVGVAGRYQLLVANGPALHALGAYLKAEYVWGF